MTAEVVGRLALARRRRLVVRLLASRVLEAVGWLGVTGITLLIVGVIGMGSAWNAHRAHSGKVQAASEAPARIPAEPPRSEATAAARMTLSKDNDVHRLLAGLALAARSSGLGWPAADYRVVAATSDRLPTLEVRCTFKAPYPNLRRFLTQVLGRLPGATIRDLQVARPSSEAPDVEAKLVLQVFLDEETVDTNMPMVAGAKP